MIRHDRVEKHRAAGKIFQKSISLPDVFFISQIPHKDGIKGKTLTFQMLSAVPGKAGQWINGRRTDSTGRIFVMAAFPTVQRS